MERSAAFEAYFIQHNGSCNATTHFLSERGRQPVFDTRYTALGGLLVLVLHTQVQTDGESHLTYYTGELVEN